MKSIKILICVLLAYFSTGWTADWTFHTELSKEGIHPQIGVDKKGNAIAVWSGDNGIYAVRFDNGEKKWNEPRMIGGIGSDVRLAVAQNGQAIVVWNRNGKIFYNSLYHSWGIEREIESTSYFDSHPSVAIDERGQALIVWQAELNESYDHSLASVVRSATYRFKAGELDSSVDISTRYDKNQVGQPEVSINATGTAVAVWRYEDGITSALPFRIQSNTYQSGRWGVEEEVSGSPTAHLILPIVAVSSTGEAMAIWLQTGYNYYVVTASIRTESWNTLTALSDLGYVSIPIDAEKGPYLAHGAFDKEGKALAAWTFIDESLDIPQRRIQARVFQNPSWSSISTLSDSAFSSGDVKIALDRSGSAWAIFSSEGFSSEMDEESSFILGSRYLSEGSGWCVPEMISKGSQNSYPHIVAGVNGVFHAVWVEENRVQAARWKADPLFGPLPPEHFRGVQKKNDFATQTVFVNILKWDAPNGGLTPVSYRIYRDAELKDLIAEIPAREKLTYEDSYRKKGKQYSYYIVSVGQNFKLSAPVKVVIP